MSKEKPDCIKIPPNLFARTVEVSYGPTVEVSYEITLPSWSAKESKLFRNCEVLEEVATGQVLKVKDVAKRSEFSLRLRRMSDRARAVTADNETLWPGEAPFIVEDKSSFDKLDAPPIRVPIPDGLKYRCNYRGQDSGILVWYEVEGKGWIKRGLKAFNGHKALNQSILLHDPGLVEEVRDELNRLAEDHEIAKGYKAKRLEFSDLPR